MPAAFVLPGTLDPKYQVPSPKRSRRSVRAPQSLRAQLIDAVVTLGVTYAPYMRGILFAVAILAAVITGKQLPAEDVVRQTIPLLLMDSLRVDMQSPPSNIGERPDSSRGLPRR